MALQALDQRTNNMRAACEAVARAVDTGSLGDFVNQNNNLINEYYQDVLEHVRKSFKIAMWAAVGGFVIFLLTIVYVFVVDWGYVSEGLGLIRELVHSKSDVDVNKLNSITRELQAISEAKHSSMMTVAF